MHHGHGSIVKQGWTDKRFWGLPHDARSTTYELTTKIQHLKLNSGDQRHKTA